MTLLPKLIVLVLVGLSSAMDLRSRRIRRWLTVCGLLSGLAYSGLHGWSALEASAAGAAVGAALFGLLAVRQAAGLGDALLSAAIGAWTGWPAALAILLWSALAGLVLAVIALVRHTRRIPYAPALAAGAIKVLFF